MASEKQKIAARENGRKSKGPVTARGKAVSSQNARVHGLVGSAVVLPGESRKRFDKIHRAFYAELQPTTSVQRALVDRIVVCHWRQIRLWTMEKAGMIQAAGKVSEGETFQNELARDTAALLNSGTRWDLLQRYELIFDRQFLRNLKHFEALKERERKSAENETNPGIC